MQRDPLRPLATFNASAVLEILRKKLTPSGLTLYYIKVSTIVLTTEVNKFISTVIPTTAEAIEIPSAIPTTDSEASTNDDAADSLSNSENKTSTSRNATFDRLWVPAIFLTHALPALVQDFETKRNRPRARRGKASAVRGTDWNFQTQTLNI